MRQGSCQRLMLPTGHSGSRGRHILTFLPIALTLMLLPAMALASPPDPSWISGIYDGADGDDVVTLLYETMGINAASFGHVALLPCIPKTWCDIVTRSFLSKPFTSSPRSPPKAPRLCPLYAYVFMRRSSCHGHVEHQTFPASDVCPGFAHLKEVYAWQSL